LGLGIAALAVSPRSTLTAQQTAAQTVSVDGDDLGGVVTGPKGPEAGVWVIAETTTLPTKFVKIVVTDDQGRYLLPDLPKATYTVWVRGYGLVDSRKVQATPGKPLNLTAVVAPNALAAAQYYPAGYWFSMMQVPDAKEFPGTGPEGNGISTNIRNQAEWLQRTKNGGCMACHQLGSQGIREIPESLGRFPSSIAAWDRRVQSGQAGAGMSGGLDQMGRPRALKMFADWTDRIAKGEVPPAPQRPQGLERNVVVTLWDWADPKAYLHDVVTTDRRNPTVNGYGPMYGALELSADYLPVLDPKTNTISQIPLTVRTRTRQRQARRWQRHRPIGVTKSSGRARTTSTTRCSTKKAASGSHRPCARRRTPTTAKRGRAIHRRSSSPLQTQGGTLRCTIPPRRS
jgi:hypothetical protein